MYVPPVPGFDGVFGLLFVPSQLLVKAFVVVPGACWIKLFISVANAHATLVADL